MLPTSAWYSTRVRFWLFAAVLLLMTLYMMNLFSPLRGLPRYDFYFHYNRLYIIIQALQDGTFPFYMDNNALNGYGYFTKAFYPDLVLLPFAIVGCFTGLYVAYQSLIFTMTFLCGIFTCIVINKIYKNIYAAAVGSLLYTFASYRLFDIYCRGTLGESIVFTLLPLVSWGVYEMVKGDYKKWYILALAYFLLFNTHVISTVLVTLIVAVFLGIYYKSFVKEPVRLKYLLLSGAVALALSSYFLLPFIEQSVAGSFYFQQTPEADMFRGKEMSLGRLLYGIFAYLGNDIKLGLNGLLTAMLCLRFFIKKDKIPRSIDYGVIIGLICCAVSCEYFPWDVFPFTLLHFIQFPWRFFQISVYLAAVAAGFYVAVLLANQPVRKVLFFLLIVLVSSYGMRFGMGDELFTSETPIITAATMDFPKTVVGAEYLPAKVPSVKYIEKRGDTIVRLHTDTKTEQFARQKDGLAFELKASQKELLELPLLYYKGYCAEIDGQALELRESVNGLVEITAGKSGKVNVYYAGTIIQKTGIWLTLLSLLVLAGYVAGGKIFTTKNTRKLKTKN